MSRRLIRDGDGERLCLEDVLRRLVFFADEERDLVHVADHAPRGVHRVHFAVFAVRGDDEDGHRIDGGHDAQIFLAMLHFPSLISVYWLKMR